MNSITTNTENLPLQVLLTFWLLLFFSTLHAQQYQLNYVDELVSNPDKLNKNLARLDSSLTTARKNNDTALVIKCLIASSALNRVSLNYNTAFDEAGEALFIAEEFKEPVLLAKAHENLGVLYFLFRQNEAALENFTQSLKYYKQAEKSGKINESELFYPNYNLMLYYQRIRNRKLMLNYLDTCYRLLNTSGLSPILRVYLDCENAVDQMRAGNTDRSETLFRNSIKALEELEPGTRSYTNNHPYIVTLYVNLARLYENRKDDQNAGKYFKLAVDNITMNGDMAFYNSFAYTSYASWLYRQGDYYKAYVQLKNAKNINDNYQNARRRNNQGFLTIRDRYTEELQKKNQEINRQKLELAEKKQEILRTRILLFVLVLLVVIAAFITRSRMQYLKHQKDKELSQKKEQQAREMLEHKNRELTATMLQLIEKEEMLNAVAEHLKTNDDKTKSIKYLNSLRKQSTNLWDEFNSRFIEQNEGFYERLQEKVPGLSSNDLKICALIKLNFSGKEMATLLGISMGSVHVARHRLRKKMNIDRDVNLTGFIHSI